MEKGTEVRVVDYSDNSLADKYIGKIGTVSRILPDDDMYGELEYQVEFEDDTELFATDELEETGLLNYVRSVFG